MNVWVCTCVKKGRGGLWNQNVGLRLQGVNLTARTGISTGNKLYWMLPPVPKYFQSGKDPLQHKHAMSIMKLSVLSGEGKHKFTTSTSEGKMLIQWVACEIQQSWAFTGLCENWIYDNNNTNKTKVPSVQNMVINIFLLTQAFSFSFYAHSHNFFFFVLCHLTFLLHKVN